MNPEQNPKKRFIVIAKSEVDLMVSLALMAGIMMGMATVIIGYIFAKVVL